MLVDAKTRSVTFEDGLKMDYRRLFIATGSRLVRCHQCTLPLSGTNKDELLPFVC